MEHVCQSPHQESWGCPVEVLTNLGCQKKQLALAVDYDFPWDTNAAFPGSPGFTVFVLPTVFIAFQH